MNITQIKSVKKRNGRIIPFDQNRITQAVLKALESTQEGCLIDASRISNEVICTLEKKFANREEIPSVEDIQDIVERILILSHFPETAKAYILYRDLHSRMRKVQNLFDAGTWIDSYINKKNWKIHSDSEIDYHLQGMYKKITDEISERYWMNEVYTKEMRALHYNKDIHIHKSSSISAYCVGWDLEDLLLNGFGGVPGNTSSAPAKHFRVVLGQIVNFLYTLTNETPDGAVALSSLDTYLAPFIYFDKLKYNEIKQSIQEFMYNMNMPTKSGGQVVFSNITLDLTCPKHMENSPVITGGKLQESTYGKYQEQMDLFNQIFFEIYTEGDSKGRAFTWPIPTYNITKNFDWNNKKLEGLWKMTGKYGIPYFANFVNSDLKPEDARSMCCRLRIDNRKLHKRGGGLFGANPLTGSIGYVTINLPRLGYLNKGKKRAFYNQLKYLLNVSRKILQVRRSLIEDLTEKGMYPYSKYYLRNVKEHTGKYWTNHYSTIGVIGMNEACLNFLGKDITTKSGKNFANRVLDFINNQLLLFQKEDSDVLFNLEASPAEATSYEMAKKDKELFEDIIVANEKEYQKREAEPYYTNSTQLPVDFTDDIFEALNLQDDLQCKYTGGTVFHAFIGEQIDDWKSLRLLIRKIAVKYKLPYFTITPTFSICETHGYLKGEQYQCPKCGNDCNVHSRVVGKISPITRWNPGKREEFKQRKTFCLK